MQLMLWIKAVGRHWWALMSCAIFTFIGVYAAHANKNNDWVVRSTLAAAVVCLFIACFLAWKDEHKVVLQESAKRQQAEQRFADNRPILVLKIRHSTVAPWELGENLFEIQNCVFAPPAGSEFKDFARSEANTFYALDKFPCSPRMQQRAFIAKWEQTG